MSSGLHPGSPDLRSFHVAPKVRIVLMLGAGLDSELDDARHKSVTIATLRLSGGRQAERCGHRVVKN